MVLIYLSQIYKQYPYSIIPLFVVLHGISNNILSTQLFMVLQTFNYRRRHLRKTVLTTTIYIYS